MPEETSCQCCFATKSRIIQGSSVYLNSTELKLVKCVECGLVYLNPQPVGNEIIQMYPEDYFIKWYGSEKKREFSKAFFRQILRRFKLKPEPGQSILDLGCGMGFFLEVAREWGCDVKGIDISPYATRYCRDHLDFNVHCGTLETANYQNESFDFITAFDFLEHIHTYASFLSKVKSLLKTNGMFIVLVPNYDSLVFQLDRIICNLKKRPLPNVPEHITYFTFPTLEKLFQENGLKVDKIFGAKANDEGQHLLMRGPPGAVLRALLNKFCYMFGKISHRRETILAVVKK